MNLQETIEFQESLNDETICSIPESDDLKYNDTLGKELQDKYVGICVLLPRGDTLNEGVVLNQKRTADGNLLQGKESTNPILETRVYEVQFPDGGISEYTTNIIVESLYSNCDDNGQQYSLLKGIFDHRKTDKEIPMSNGHVELNGVKRKQITTAGWEFRFIWEDGSTS